MRFSRICNRVSKHCLTAQRAELMGSGIYYALLASLPAQDSLLQAKFTPLSRQAFRKRLSMLTPEDAALFTRIADILAWNRLGPERTEEQYRATVRQLLADLDSETLREIVTERMEVRSILAALRRRAGGEAAPSEADSATLYFGNITGRIARHWQEPGLGLANVYPWVVETDRQLRAGNYYAVEKLVLDWLWRRLPHYLLHHAFDFEAVVVYALRWDLVERWVRYEPEAAKTQFDTLLNHALKTLPEGVSHAETRH